MRAGIFVIQCQKEFDMKRYDTDEAVKSITADVVWSVKFVSVASEQRQRTGQRIIVTSRPSNGSTDGLMWSDKHGAFLKDIKEVLPENPSVFNQSKIYCEWTQDIAEAMQFKCDGSDYRLQCNGVNVRFVWLRTGFTSSHVGQPSIERFHAQSTLDNHLSIQEKKPVMA